MNVLMSEFIGTMLLILLGNGVVANVVLRGTKGNGSGWLVITMGWAMAVFAAVLCSGKSGAHLNPAITIALAAAGKFTEGGAFCCWACVPKFIAAQMLGAIAGASLVWLQHKDHYAQMNAEDGGDILATFSTGPAIRNTVSNLISEIIGTFVLVYVILCMPSPEHGLGAVGAIPVAFLVLGVGLCLGGTTGYAINPARDLGPRIAHFLLPIAGKGSSDWSYAWIPVVGPILGGLLAVALHSCCG
ncbi:MAG: hypothetical protein RLZZ292_182 [Bacteroidota bacterium]|jgi:glycerol uptake facilitator protein